MAMASRLVAAGTPDTTNPVSDQAEVNEVPCVTTNCPWQPYFFGRKGDPAKGFNWTYHFFWGLEDIAAVNMEMWNAVDTNKQVAAIYSNDSDGMAFTDEAGRQQQTGDQLSATRPPDRPLPHVRSPLPRRGVYRAATVTP